MRYYVEAAQKPSPSFEELLKLAQDGDPAGKQAVDRMCAALGRGMHTIACALAPSEIIVVGDITTLWQMAGPLIEAEMLRDPLVRAPKIRPAQDGNKARLRSAVALVMHENLL
jgi:predicted NBD/HSP70 family sugar kinase